MPLFQNLPNNAAVGVDPWCISVDTAQRWEHAFAKNQQKLVQTSTNLVDEVWKNRPPAETNPVIVHPLEFAGYSVTDKLRNLREKLIQDKAQGIIITALDEVCSSCSCLYLLLYCFRIENQLASSRLNSLIFIYKIKCNNCNAGCLVI